MSSEDIAQLRRQINHRSSQLQRVESMARNAKIYPGFTPTISPVMIRIGKGNKISSYGTAPTKVYGIKKSATSITQIPAAVMSGTDPDVTAAEWESYTDGLCFGYLNDDATGTAVFVAEIVKPTGGSDTHDIAITSAIREGARVYARRYIMLQKSTDATVLVPVYLIWRA